MILAGDVGGTKIHLALYGFEGGRLKPVRDELFPAHQFTSLDAVVKKFLADEAGIIQPEQIAAACFGCPGPVRNGRIQLTNLPWMLDQHDLAHATGVQHIFLINDLEANGYGIPELAPEQVATLHEGDAGAVGNRGLISAGTGLGEALLIWEGHAHRPVASEGGHCDFAPRSDREVALLRYLRDKLNVPPEKFVVAMSHCGNTVSSTIPIALREARDRLNPGQFVMLVGFGVGYSWGATLVRWHG